MTNEQSKHQGGAENDIYAWTLTVTKSPSASSVWFSHLSNDSTQQYFFPQGSSVQGGAVTLLGVSGSPDYWTVCYTDASGNLWVTNDFQQRDSGPNAVASLVLAIGNPNGNINTGTITFTWGSVTSPSTQVINLNFTLYYAANP